MKSEKSTRLPADIPAHQTAVDTVDLRLKKRGPADPVTGDKLLPPRELAWKTLCQARLECYPKEKTTIYPSTEPWNWDTADMDIDFSTNLMGCMGKQDAQINIENAAASLLQQTSPEDIIIFTDGSAMEGTRNGGAGAVISIPGQQKAILKRACGVICSSYRAEMTAIEIALEYLTAHMSNHPEDLVKRKVWVITDSVERLGSCLLTA